MSDITDFAQRLVEKGIELTLRKTGRLHVWPGRSYKRLTDAERAFIDARRAELRELVQSGRQPKLPDDFVASTQEDPQPDFSATTSPDTPCVYCCDPCVGKAHPAYRTLHWNDPAEVARRGTDAVRRRP